MAKHVLIVGGSYFVGRVFTLLAARKEDFILHVVNRGNHPFNNKAIRQYVSDRHDTGRLTAILPEREWDAVVDFCAYEPGECRSLLNALRGGTKQYILISTCSVYDPAFPAPRSEDSPLMLRAADDPGTRYAWDKVLLEQEAKTACAASSAAGTESVLTVLRPAFIYGPFNYAPRESYYFDRVLRCSPVAHPVDATGRFSFVYVKDVAAAIMACIGNSDAYGETFNLAAPEIVDYRKLIETIEKAHGTPLSLQEVTVAEVYERNIPLPFPLDADERYAGDKAVRMLSMAYTSFAEGMKESYDIYRNARATTG